MKKTHLFVLLPALIAITSCTPHDQACFEMFVGGLRPVATDRADRFEGKVDKAVAFCRGGQHAVDFMGFPWVDWGNYYATGDATSKAPGDTGTSPLSPNGVGLGGALLDLEYGRIELIKFNLFDNNGTFRTYLLGKNHVAGPAVKSWDSFRLPKDDPNYAQVGGDAPQQICTGDLIRKRTLTGICNDLLNPLMGSTNQLFARNVEFETSFPDKGLNELTRNRHGDRIGLLKPDPQVISRRLFTRAQSNPEACRAGLGAADPSASNCDYQKANSLNVLAAFWIQFMTHDWFSHMEEGHNDSEYEKTGCATHLVNNREEPLSPADIARLGCRPEDLIDRGYIAQNTPPGLFTRPGSTRQYMERAPLTMRNTNTAWWDASQIYGYDEVSVKRVKRDPSDRAKLLLTPLPGKSAADGLYLPLLSASDPMNPQWVGQEATAFPDNWTIGISFLTNLFAREHDAFVDEFRKQAGLTPNADCGLRNPSAPTKVIRYQDVTPDELYDAARLVVAAEIAKIHTIEWTPQLLYNEPLYQGMNANWNGLVGSSNAELTKILQHVAKTFGKSKDPDFATTWYSVFASGPGIVGMGSRDRHWNVADPAKVNGGVNHFGSPFNFPEEFVSVYRLHPLVPDLLEYRDLKGDANRIVEKVAVIDTFRAKATDMRTRGLSNWALSMGRQRLGALTLRNEPMFLQNLPMPRLDSPTKTIDVAALDLIRDREHGMPRFNEFRRQYGLRQLTSFDDFVDPDPNLSSADRREQQDRAQTLRELYGQHICDASKYITDAQKNPDGSPITDCLGKPNRTLIDNVEDLDTVVGYLAETRHQHGFAISETQFVVFLLNASRRLFSDRFLTSSFRPEFYTTIGLKWVNNNGPGDAMMEKGQSNGHAQPVSPLKRALLRAMPDLGPELANVINAFDPWARARGEYYTLDWKPRPGAESDPSFK